MSLVLLKRFPFIRPLFSVPIFILLATIYVELTLFLLLPHISHPQLSFVGVIAMQVFCLRWYNCLAAVIGFAFIFVGVKGMADSNRSLLNVFLFSQMVGALVVFIGSIIMMASIANWREDDGYCRPKGIYYAGAVLSPFTFLFFLFGAIYSKRATNLFEYGRLHDEIDNKKRQMYNPPDTSAFSPSSAL